MRRRLAIGLGVLLIVLLVFYASAHLLTSRYAWARAVAWMESDTGDQFRFPSRAVKTGTDTSPLPRGETPEALTTPVNVGGVGRSLETFLAGTDTTAFLVVHDDRLVYERYLNGAEPEDRQTSFSAAKSFVSTLVGIAVAEGHIASITDPITDYLPELAERDERFREITIRDLLTMSSGIAYTEGGLPWSDDALTYYGTDLRDLALTSTHVEEAAVRSWRYNNFHPLLLGLILEQATKMSVSAYMSSRLWQPLGAEAGATWSLDSRKSGFEKMESGLNARPVDFARFGLMMLHEGRWNDRQIVSADWVKEATAVSHETDPVDFYQYLWWVGAPRPGESRAPFFAHGKYGQLVGVFPEDDVVIVRLGSADGGVDWQARLRDMAGRVAAEGQGH